MENAYNVIKSGKSKIKMVSGLGYQFKKIKIYMHRKTKSKTKWMKLDGGIGGDFKSLFSFVFLNFLKYILYIYYIYLIYLSKCIYVPNIYFILDIYIYY